jgi:hypothetical protein
MKGSAALQWIYPLSKYSSVLEAPSLDRKKRKQELPLEKQDGGSVRCNINFA